MWITSTEYRKKYNITPQHLYALKKSGKITFKPYVGKEVLILDENDLNDDKLNCVYARITSKESEDVLNEQITYIKKYMVSNGFNPDEVYWNEETGFFSYGWTKQANMRKFKNWFNAESRKCNIQL